MELIDRYPTLKTCEKSIQDSINILVNCFKSNYKLLLVGNGGSACDCDHISGELLKGFKSSRKLTMNDRLQLGEELAVKLQGSLPAIPLTNFQGLGSAFGNDCDPQYTYAQLVWALGNSNDVLFAISTSGNSKNIINSVQVAKKKQMKTICLTGMEGGNLKDLCDCSILVPKNETYQVQELHLPIYHYICIELEKYFFGDMK